MRVPTAGPGPLVRSRPPSRAGSSPASVTYSAAVSGPGPGGGGGRPRVAEVGSGPRDPTSPTETTARPPRRPLQSDRQSPPLSFPVDVRSRPPPRRVGGPPGPPVVRERPGVTGLTFYSSTEERESSNVGGVAVLGPTPVSTTGTVPDG